MAKKTLIIVESPTKANTIKNFLGSDCRIIASKGHITTLPTVGMAIDIKHGYKPQYIIDEKKKDVIAEMKKALKDADELILATDEDREGESISWHILDVLKPTIPYRRMVFHEITKKAITQAFNNGRDIDISLVKAQEARRVLDRLFGYSVSPLLWSKLGNNSLSAGRVQSAGLRLIVDRERKRMAYIKTEYWDIKSTFSEGFYARLETLNSKRVANSKDFNPDTGKFNASSKAVLLTREDTEAAIAALKGDVFTVTDISDAPSVQAPPAPFMTSTLQQESNRKLHMSAKDTMSHAQTLYERGFITYMRTDSISLSEEGTEAARKAAAERYGKAFVSDSPRKYTSKSVNAQEAHEAIRPAGETFLAPEETGLTGRDLSLYTLIYRRTLASQMKNAQKVNTSVTIQAGDSTFAAYGVRVEFQGFLKAYVEGTDHDEDQAESTLPKLEKGQVLNVSSLESVMHETKEPARFTEASLVKELESLGIGRPSTYASIIDRIIEKEYVKKENNVLIPTFTGFGIIQFLEKCPKYIDYKFTSNMEEDLDRIAKNEVTEEQFLKDFYEGHPGLEEDVKNMKETIVPMSVKKIHLPQVSEENTVTLGKFGPYIQDKDGTYYSVPANYYPYNVTDEMLDALKAKKPGNPIVGTTDDGLPIFYCTGKYGDYWQIGDVATNPDVKRFTVPKDLLGVNVSKDDILAFFALPRTVGKTEDGQEITANIGKYGPYLKCGDSYCNRKNSMEILHISEQEARKVLAENSKHSTSSKKSSSAAKKTAAASPVIVKDFGVQDGERLDIRQGRYGYYLKHGSENYRLAPKYQHDEQACIQMPLEEALSALKKS